MPSLIINKISHLSLQVKSRVVLESGFIPRFSIFLEKDNDKMNSPIDDQIKAKVCQMQVKLFMEILQYYIIICYFLVIKESILMMLKLLCQVFNADLC